MEGLAGNRGASAGGDIVAALRGVHYAVDGKPVFRGVDVEFRRGHVTAIMGPSGTGKTTLLRLVTGQIRADRGSVEVEGREVASRSRDELYAMRRRMGMLFQNGALLTDLDVFENVAFRCASTHGCPSGWCARSCSRSSTRSACGGRRRCCRNSSPEACPAASR